MLTKRDLERYDRQIVIPNFGREGQEKLKGVSVAVAGVGGLGSAVGIYLAVAGIGRILIIDNDKIKVSNLNRQILYWDEDVGKNKVESAVEKIMKMNSDIKIIGIKEKIGRGNVTDLLKYVDAIVDCMDNFPSRYLLNDASLKLGIPLFHGACEGLEGRATTIIPRKTPCLKCIYPRFPSHKKFPILGAVTGTIGTIQATEVVKFFVGMEPLLTNKLLVYDAQFLTYDLIKIERDPKCPSCGGLNED
ncbi:MAG: HesA/MoeB/ThiF family protein [Candidatus Thermoplasmatota archaeon]|nr:HesA/MoeB/ThiF family protein [Candidatus Thermoplasmatota archaeon]